MELIGAPCGAQSEPSPRAERYTKWPKEKIGLLSVNAASRTQFSQLQAIITGHVSIIYRQIRDILSVFATENAAA